jgi:hypothetical protein
MFFGKRKLRFFIAFLSPKNRRRLSKQVSPLGNRILGHSRRVKNAADDRLRLLSQNHPNFLLYFS